MVSPITQAAWGTTGDGEPTDEAIYLIQLEGDPLATYRGTVKGLAATSPKATGTGKLDVRSAAAQAYAARLSHQRADAVSQMEFALNRAVKPVFEYDTAFNGLAARLTAAEAARLAAMPGVVRIERDRLVGIQNAGLPAPLSALAVGSTGSGAAGSGPQMTFLFFPSTLLLISLWRAARRRPRAWRWVAVSAGLLAVTAACGGSGDDHRTVEPPADIEPSPGAALIGAPGVWSGRETGDLPGTMGEEVVVGIIDTGINPHSPSFAEKDESGFRHTNPRKKYYGVCDPENRERYNPNFPCNDKLIGAWSFVSDDFNHTTDNPVDFNGHGTHVAATAAGNIVRNAVMYGPSGVNLTQGISGVAPHANIISYRVLGADGFGRFSQMLVGLEQAIQDGVDVINMSIGGELEDPWRGLFGPALLSAREAGIAVAVAAGNSGPDPSSIVLPGILPWAMTVAAGTHGTAYVNSLSLAGGPSDLSPIEGLSLSAGYGPASIIYAGDYGDPLCRGEFTGEFKGEIVVCDRGEIFRLDQGKNVKENGGGGMVLAEIKPGGEEALFTDAHFLPAVHIAKADADRLKEWLSEGSDHSAVISGTTIEAHERNADLVTGFSSRGWNAAVQDVIKPDILAPGFAVVAPAVDGIGYAVWQGTSMATPHVAGVFALLKALHPEWSPSEAQSAIMTTAVQGLRVDAEGTSATPFDAGAGRIAAGRASRAALVLDETAAGFENADPESYWVSAEAGIGDPAALNQASLGEGACIGRCSWTRVVRSVAKKTTRWAVTVEAGPDLLLTADPETFNLAPGESVVITVTADVSEAPLEQWAFGRVVLSESESAAPDAGLPVAVRPATENLPELLEIRTEDGSGSKSFFRFAATGIVDLSISSLSLIPAMAVTDVLDSDPTPEDPANMDGGVYLEYVDVPADAAALLITLDSSDAPDLKVYAGMGDSTEPLAQSSKSGSSESVTVLAPAAGRWWIGVHNPAPDRQADPFTLRYGVISAKDGAAENLTATPDRTDGSPFGITLNWELPGAVAGDHWYGAIILGSSPAKPNDIGAIPVKVVVK